jgi:hypothetical protein
MKRAARAILAAGFVVATALAADPAYVGKWKINTSKSTLTGDTATIANGANGMLEFDSQGFQYKFKPDGKEYPTPSGGTTAWTATSNDVWDVTNKLSGKTTSTYHLVLKGDVLSITGKSMKPDGGSMDFSSTYKRVSGGPGFVGKWMSTDVKMPSTTMEISSNGADGVMLKDDTGPICSGQFDGKDNPALGMMAGSKTTCSFKKVSGGSFELTSKTDGKAMYVEVYSVSSDGKTLTINGTPSNAKGETYKVVFDRQ